MIIERRFCGPPDSGNGGYVAGRLAQLVDGPAAVRLHVPPPLEVDLEVRREDARVVLTRGDDMIAQARPTELGIEAPEPPSLREARESSEAFRGFESHWFPSCFVCGPHRDARDGLRIFAGPVRGRNLVAAPWIPDDSLGSANGMISPEFVWAALDCPGAFAFAAPPGHVVLLGELAATLPAGAPTGEACVVCAWEIDREGRKHYTGSALFGESGACYGLALGTWFEVPESADERSATV